MSKRRASVPRPTSSTTDSDVPVVGGREPCPCGSGRRYKACHGKAAATQHRVVRPFAGMASEPDWVALHDLVPAATATLTPTNSDRSVTLCTLLPMAWPALVRQNGEVMLAAQTQTSSADVARDLGDALAQALVAEPGTPVPPRPLPVDAPSLTDLIDAAQPLHVVVHSGFDFWLDDAEAADESARAGLELANEIVSPTARLASVEGAYWMLLGERRQLRWVLPEDEAPLVDALARLQVDAGLELMKGTRFLGSFRASGLVVPVWDLPDGTEVEEVEDAAAEFRARLDWALADATPLSGAGRRVRESLRARQLTVH
ncbi:MAG: DUF5926 family protein [Actinomycetia bacterium]|nr:DUF5926 family protein [Actinomycetes bacterium]